ncbi:MAG: flagellar biosynthetic protein FliR [Micromonosporaceae bacterium]|nr:flagellar biosynthetic protein FliR [Micromonosporaceae bacterium]
MSLTLPLATIIGLLLGSIRAAAWLATCPPFSGRGLPPTAKGLLSVAIALPFTEELSRGMAEGITTAGLITDAVEQIVVGAALGFCTNLLVTAVQAAGSIIDLFGGFSVAFAFDPLSYTGNAVMGRFYNLLATALLFTTGAYQSIVAGFARSYRALPPTGSLSLERLDRILVNGLSEMFIAALQISGPIVAVLFLTDLALGLLTKVSPQLNAFGLGFPAKIMLTLILVGMGMKFIPAAVERVAEKAVAAVLEVLGS